MLLLDAAPTLQAALALPTSSIHSLPPPPHEFTFFCEPRHDEAPPPGAAEQQQQAQQPGAGQQSASGAASPQAGGQLVVAGQAVGEGLVSKWRQKERLKTTAVALVMCLNIGAFVCGGAQDSSRLPARHHAWPAIACKARAAAQGADDTRGSSRRAAPQPSHPFSPPLCLPGQVWTRPT